MVKRVTFLALGLAVLPALGCGGGKTSTSTPPATAERPHFEASDTMTAHVPILAVDQANRMITVKRGVGDTATFEVGPEVKNFAQLKAGDVIDVVYVEHLSVDVEPPGATSTSSGSTMSSAKPGEKPGMVAGQVTETRASIAAIDTVMGTATLQTADGNHFNVTPANPENLRKVSVGDIVVFTHTQVVAVSVAPAKKGTAHKKPA